MAMAMNHFIVHLMRSPQFRPETRDCQCGPCAYNSAISRNPAAPAQLTHPPIRSYVLRQGRFSRGQQRAYSELLPRFGLVFARAHLDYVAIFGRKAPVVAE